MNPWDEAWDTSKVKGASPFDAALAAEGVSGPVADIARSIYTQESSSGKNTKTSNRGAVGGMQILPGTFASVADKGWDIGDPVQNARAGIRYLKQGYDAAGGDPALTGAFYYGGPGGLEKARKGIAVSDPLNPNAPNTLQYGQQVAARLPKEKGMLQRGVEAVIPSAQAAELPSTQAKMPWDEEWATPAKTTPAAAEPAPPETGAAFGVYPNARRQAKNNTPNASDAIVMGLARGIKDPIDTGAELLASGYDKLTGNGPNVSGLVTGQQGEGARVRAMNQQGKQDFADQYGGSSLASGARVGGNILATLPVGPALGVGAKAVGMERLGNALASGGMTAAQKVGPGFLNGAADLGIRSLGGAATGAATAGLIDPNSTALGAGVGGALPVVGRGAALAGNALGATVRPFYAAGQNRIAGDVLRDTAANPTNALAQLRGSAPMVPGSMPTTAMAAGDEGLAALSRTMQSASPEYASALAARQTAQNQARTSALEGIAGNTGKIDLAKAARDSSTGPMREAVLDAAGSVPSDSILKSIDRLIKNPNNAGELSQQALNKFRDRIAGLSDNGAIDARALYEVRKDINTLLGGKLQGEAGNLRYASSQLGNVKGLIDDAIDQASRRVAAPAGPVAGAPLSSSREVVPFVPSTEVGMPRGNALQARPQGQVGPVLPQAAEEGAGAARPTWRGYLQSYSEQSIPIGQMGQLEKILTKVKSDAAASDGELFLSATKMNNLLKNKDAPLLKGLSPEQLQILRNIQSDLNAGQIANNVGRAVGSNTVQNLAQNQLLQGALGNVLGGSTTATTTLGRLLQLPYGAANKQIQERLANALLNPQEAAKLLAEPQTSALRNALSRGVQTIGYRSAPALTAR